MIRAVTVTFDVNDETGDVTNVKTSVEGEVKKTRKTTSKKTLEDDNPGIPTITREDSKLTFNNKALEVLGVDAGDRVLIKLEKKKNKFIPVIASSEVWDNPDQGNKLTKSNTVAFKGKQNDALAEFGSKFILTEYKEGIFALESQDNDQKIDTIEEAIEAAEETKPILIVGSDEETDIDELAFKL